MTNTPLPYDEIDSLSLLAHKIAPRVFDLSSRQINVSIRDQMVRAQQLVRDLRRADPDAKSVLIVGMGAAGMTAALSACETGFPEVCAFDVAAQPFSLFKGVHSRYVGPFMYEWPSSFHDIQSYPMHQATPWTSLGSCPLTWQSPVPLSAHEFGKALLRGLGAWSEHRVNTGESRPSMLVKVDRNEIRKYLKTYTDHGYKVWLASQGKTSHPGARPNVDFKKMRGQTWGGRDYATVPSFLQPDYIILAVGMGIETSKISEVTKGKTPRFWSNDKLKQPTVANQHVVVVGGGDGAMQDAFRSLTQFDHPLSFVRHLEACSQVRKLLDVELPALLSADRQMRQHNSWSANDRGFAMVDEACKGAAKRLAASKHVLKQVQKKLRLGSGHVSLLVRGEHFDKAYLLNRFVAYLLAYCVQPAVTGVSLYMGFTLKFNTEIIRHIRPGKRNLHGKVTIQTTGAGARQQLIADHVVVRFGIRPDSIPGLQLVQLSDPNAPGGNSRQRTTLSRVELPFVTM